MASTLKIKVNGLVHSVTANLDTPLLYVLHNELHLHGPRFGCGLAQCGACSVLLDGKEIRSCVTPVAAVSGKAITTLEGLPALWAKERGTTAASPALHPLQQAWIDVQVPHCGYCQNGMMIQAAGRRMSCRDRSISVEKPCSTRGSPRTACSSLLQARTPGHRPTYGSLLKSAAPAGHFPSSWQTSSSPVGRATATRRTTMPSSTSSTADRALLPRRSH